MASSTPTATSLTSAPPPSTPISTITDKQWARYERLIEASRTRMRASTTTGSNDTTATTNAAAAVVPVGGGSGGGGGDEEEGNGSGGGGGEWEWEWTVAVGTLGEHGVGRSSFRRLCVGLASRVANGLGAKELECDQDLFYHGTFDLVEKGKHSVLKTKMWDSNGEDKCQGVAAGWHEKCAGFFVLFDVSDHVTFDFVRDWIAHIRGHTSAEQGDILPKVFIVGNKSDLAREVTPEEIQALCSQFGGVPYFEVSCSTCQGVQECWNAMISSAYHDLVMLANCLPENSSKHKKKSAEHCSLS
ncbi:hypothetical protein Pelo_17934 [Pelomyxa schiedti]|nr:hypothetical protein Pelo_17934 [Pelomyxa schiedti]